jgi:Ribosomal protein S6
MKKVSMEIVKGGGIVRAIHNHGIRELPHRFRAKYADKQGDRYQKKLSSFQTLLFKLSHRHIKICPHRYYGKGRFLSIYYDSNPVTMKQVEQTLSLNEEVLRNTHLKARSILDYVNISREERNPYITQVKLQQEKDRAAIRHRNQTVEQVIEDMRIDDASV